MCAVSFVGDELTKPWKAPDNPLNPFTKPFEWPTSPQKTDVDKTDFFKNIFSHITREEFEKLKAEVEAIKNILLAAKKYDEITNQPNCEMEEKVGLFKQVAKVFGIDISPLFPDDKPGENNV